MCFVSFPAEGWGGGGGDYYNINYLRKKKGVPAEISSLIKFPANGGGYIVGGETSEESKCVTDCAYGFVL